LRRAYRVESGLFERARSAWREGSTEQTSDIDLVFLRLSTSNGDELGKLSRYEAAIERSLRRALQDLERRQRYRAMSQSELPLGSKSAFKPNVARSG
jgi:hypothetical protein